MDTTFSVGAEFATATITPTGTVVVVATVDGLEATRRDEAQIRDDSGTWLPISSA